MNNRERDALEDLGDDVCALNYIGRVVITEPWRLPLPRQEAFVSYLNAMRDEGTTPDMVGLVEWCVARGIDVWPVRYTFSKLVEKLHCDLYYPTPESVEGLKQKVMEGSALVRVALLFESGADEIARGRFPSKQYEMLRKGGRDGA